MQCTEVSATWCQNCGDCRCPTNAAGETISDDGERLARDSERCPLHAPWSKHGEIEEVETMWGTFTLPGE